MQIDSEQNRRQRVEGAAAKSHRGGSSSAAAGSEEHRLLQSFFEAQEAGAVTIPAIKKHSATSAAAAGAVAGTDGFQVAGPEHSAADVSMQKNRRKKKKKRRRAAPGRAFLMTPEQEAAWIVLAPHVPPALPALKRVPSGSSGVGGASSAVVHRSIKSDTPAGASAAVAAAVGGAGAGAADSAVGGANGRKSGDKSRRVDHQNQSENEDAVDAGRPGGQNAGPPFHLLGRGSERCFLPGEPRLEALLPRRPAPRQGWSAGIRPVFVEESEVAAAAAAAGAGAVAGRALVEGTHAEAGRSGGAGAAAEHRVGRRAGDFFHRRSVHERVGASRGLRRSGGCRH